MSRQFKEALKGEQQPKLPKQAVIFDALLMTLGEQMTALAQKDHLPIKQNPHDQATNQDKSAR